MDKKKDGIGNNLFVGFMFIGLGVGFYTGNIPMWVLIGMGVGFISKALFGLLNKD